MRVILNGKLITTLLNKTKIMKVLNNIDKQYTDLPQDIIDTLKNF
jgi:hypothetical protein